MMNSPSVDGKKKYIVITSINAINEAIQKFASINGWQLILVGDRKGPKKIDDKRIIFLSIDQQKDLDFEYILSCPENHYSRKNIGYLYAIDHGANIIGESDDDNIPQAGWGNKIRFCVPNIEIVSQMRYFNVYSEFSESNIWPRGFPLDKILYPKLKKSTRKPAEIGVIQQLVNKNPDVDAIYRLTCNKLVQFKNHEIIGLDHHTYCPFNSQNTFWSPKAFPLMYLPQTVTFRFTDILRGYIAQRLLWEENLLLAFDSPSVVQERNPHNFMQDFEDEIPVYTNVDTIVEILESTKYSDTPLKNIQRTYEQLYAKKIVGELELTSLECWISDLKKMGLR